MSDIAFVQASGPEPHRVRRRALLKAHPDLRRLMGHDPATAWIIVGLVAVQLALSGLFARVAGAYGAWLLVPLAYVVGATLNHWLAMGIHEASHDLALSGTRNNRLLAIAANIPLVIPSAMAFRRHHHDHHKYLGIEGKDNDLPSVVERAWVGHSRLRKLLWLLSFPLTAPFSRGFMKRPDRWERWNIAVQIVANAAIVYALGGHAILYLILSSFFGAGLHPVAAHWIHEHYLVHGRQETTSYVGPLNHVTFHVGYHVEHHDLPNIPGSRLRAIRNMAPEFYEGLDSDASWTRVLIRFVMDPAIAHTSRIARAR